MESIVLLPAQRNEYQAKPGGGQTPTPIVPVDSNLRSTLTGQLQAIHRVASREFPGIAQGVPLTTKVRPEALAKTKRPYAFLASAEMMPVAAEARGEMISRATPASTRALSAAIQTGNTKADTYAISTFESFRIWDPVDDAFRFAPGSSAESVIEEAKNSHIPLRIELFPWLSAQSIWGAENTLETYLASIGLPISSIAGSNNRTALYLEVTEEASLGSFRTLFGVRSAVLAPSYSAPRSIHSQSFRVLSSDLPVTIADPIADEAVPSVGVLDSGIAHGLLDPWVARRWTYDVGSDLDTTHGTFVAGLVIASRSLNGGVGVFPDDSALVCDAQVLSAGSVSEDLLIARITEVLGDAGTNGPRVWNCSFNDPNHMDPVVYGTLSQELDMLGEAHNVLFVQSAGNYPTLRSWPPDGSTGPADGLATPAESVNSLTVGSLSHLGGMTPVGAVSSYSRRGPSFGGQQKPEVTHWSGDVDVTGGLNGYGIRSVGPNGEEMESVGTSFSTPIVSGIAANIWKDLEAGTAGGNVAPALVKGLVIHSATASNMPIEDDHRIYYGAGVPRGGGMALLDSSHTFTTVHEVELRTGVNWEKRPFPVPACLLDERGKLRATVTLTVSYSPVIDPAFGEECIRTCVEPSFGAYKTKSGEEKFHGQMGGSHDWESTLVERGKWSPVKTYRKTWPSGVGGGGDWALKLRLTARDSSIEPLVQKAFVVITMEGLDESLPVYQDGLKAVQQLRYPNALALNATRLSLRNAP